MKCMSIHMSLRTLIETSKKKKVLCTLAWRDMHNNSPQSNLVYRGNYYIREIGFDYGRNRISSFYDSYYNYNEVMMINDYDDDGLTGWEAMCNLIRVCSFAEIIR